MENKDLINLLSEIFIPLGYKKKGNYWVCNMPEINKIINLVNSQHGELYYIYFGFMINSLKQETRLKYHVFRGLGSFDPKENARITALLFPEKVKDIDTASRLLELKGHINNQIVNPLSKIITEQDLVDYLLTWPTLVVIPNFVLVHLKLAEPI